MVRFKDIDEARKTLGLKNAASSDEIKRAYRRKALRHHPDKGSKDGEEMKKINLAYELLSEYCSRYKFTFTKEDWARAYPGEAYFERMREFF